MPNNHGGCRAGAGAPYGNINALKRARHSSRYHQAQILLDVLDVLWRHELAMPREPAARRARRKLLLDAARQFITEQVGYAEYTEELISSYVRVPGAVSRQDEILHWLEQPRGASRWLRPLVIAFHICEENEALGEKVTRHLIDWLMAYLHQSKDPDNQTTKQSS